MVPPETTDATDPLASIVQMTVEFKRQWREPLARHDEVLVPLDVPTGWHEDFDLYPWFLDTAAAVGIAASRLADDEGWEVNVRYPYYGPDHETCWRITRSYEQTPEVIA